MDLGVCGISLSHIMRINLRQLRKFNHERCSASWRAKCACRRHNEDTAVGRHVKGRKKWKQLTSHNMASKLSPWQTALSIVEEQSYHNCSIAPKNTIMISGQFKPMQCNSEVLKGSTPAGIHAILNREV